MRVITEVMTNYKVQNPKGKRSSFGIKTFRFQLSFGFWDLEFSQWDCHALLPCRCEARRCLSNLGVPHPVIASPDLSERSNLGVDGQWDCHTLLEKYRDNEKTKTE